MVSRSAASASAHLLLVFLCGVAAFASLDGGLWATALICVLAAALAALPAARSLLEARPAATPLPPLADVADLARERERRTLGHFLDHAPVPLLTSGADGRLRAANRAARRLFAATDLIPTPPQALAAAIRRARPGERQVLSLAPDGAPRTYALSVAEVAGDGGPVRLVALTDIQAEIGAAEAGALRDILQVLSHEIMNSLTPVTSLAQTARQLLAEEGPGAARDARDAVDTLARRTAGLLHFVEAYRILARLPAPTLRDTSLSTLLDDVVRLFRSRWDGRGVTLEMRAPAADAVLRLDPDLASQALLNVLANGAEAALAAPGGSPKVALSAALPPRGGLEVTVSDNGEGVGAADPALVFRPFYTTKPEGTGVGLSLARQVVLGHGGDIRMTAPGLEGAGVAVTLLFGPG